MIIENFDDFYDHYQGFSAYVAFCITEDYELSKDISQEVFLALFKVKEKLDYSRPDKLKALVMKATSNKCMDYYRKASSRQESDMYPEFWTHIYKLGGHHGCFSVFYRRHPFCFCLDSFAIIVINIFINSNCKFFK